jgi:GT2 family glycosyltransferase/glycosyltransferase involved in cell wall biosynthesis
MGLGAGSVKIRDSTTRPSLLIDVIIPVFQGLAETRRAIDSVLAARCETPREVVVIDDRSPEPEISAWLQALAESGRITLLRHDDNRGFVASVNEGMALHPDRDVLLLNSDTEVADGWLDRIVACARREPHVATVTPFSNNATICSYPVHVKPNRMPEGHTTASLDALFARENAGLAVEIPTAVGFCMFIARRALDELGAFDEAAFGRGYGEEVDFCMRAARAGYRNLLAADTFVFHEGEVSFGDSGAATRRKAQAIIDERYPEFQPNLGTYLHREPARPFRRRVDLARLVASPHPRVLEITHRWGGGVERHVRDLAKLLERDCEVLSLRPEIGSVVSIKWLREGEEFEAWFDTATDWSGCVALLRALGVARIHLHHVHGLDQKILALPQALGVPYDVTVHDHYPICPQYHLSDETGRYCGEPAAAGCNACIAKRPGQWPHEIGAWRDLFHGVLRGAERVIAPSHDLAARLVRYFPDVSPLEWSHPEMSEPARAPFKVALLGGVSAIKGIHALEACAADAARRGLPLHFHVIGHVDRPMKTWPEAPMTVSGSYPDDKLNELIGLERPDAFLFLSQVPETYSYTLSSAMRTGLPIVATRLGALPERLRGYRNHALVEPDAPAQAINDALLARLRPPAAVPAEPRADVAD